MLRCLLTQFQRSLALQLSSQESRLLKLTCVPSLSHTHLRRTIFQAQNSVENSDVINELSTFIEPDTDYIQPYHDEHEKHVSKQLVLQALCSHFHLSKFEKKRILNDKFINCAVKESILMLNLDILLLAGVNKRSFMDYPWLIALHKDRLEMKLSLLRTMAMRDINHFTSFLRLTIPRFRKLVGQINQESKTVPHKNRIYYISESLKLDPYVVSQYLSDRLFVLEMPFDMFDQNLRLMIEYNISPLNILRDLWAFKYTPKAVKMRLERAKCAQKDKIMPWMVRCPEPILQRSFQLTQDELSVLGDKTVIEYLADRLEFSVEEMKAIMNKHPQVMRVRVTKMKEILDYLLDEAGFNRYEIAQVPRILCHGLETTKSRLEELKSYGCRPSSLVILCRSKREYEKFINYWVSIHKTVENDKIEASINDPNTIS